MEVSAGGVVIGSRAGELCVALVEKRNGKWVLPKGHVDAEETLEAAALREIGQETGLRSGLTILELLGAWPHNEHDPSRHSEKLNHYFLVEYPGAALPELSTDVDHKSARWHPLPPREIEFAYSYQAEEVLEAARTRFEALKGGS
jgi:8-oxo-dGTP pyrophosphatase MutT (NUDIX family)